MTPELLCDTGQMRILRDAAIGGLVAVHARQEKQKNRDIIHKVRNGLFRHCPVLCCALLSQHWGALSLDKPQTSWQSPERHWALSVQWKCHLQRLEASMGQLAALGVRVLGVQAARMRWIQDLVSTGSIQCLVESITRSIYTFKFIIEHIFRTVSDVSALIRIP
jgi:hypothetical protein